MQVPPLLDLFLELCALPSPSGKERAVADRVGAYLSALGARLGRRRRGRATRRRYREHLLPAALAQRPRGGRTHLSLRSHRHRSAGGCDRSCHRGRNRTKYSRNDPRVGQQGGGRGDSRRDPQDHRGAATACGHRAPVHAAGGGVASRGRRLRPHAPAGDDRLRLRPGRAHRRDRPRLAPRAAARLPLPRSRRPCRDDARGRPLGDRRSLARDRGLPARTRRRRDERERGRDLGRHGTERRAGVVLVHGRGAIARRGESRCTRPGDARIRRVRRQPRRLRGGERGPSELPRVPLPGERSAGRARGVCAAGGRVRAELRVERRRRRRERLQRARPAVREPRERDDGDPHARRAHRRRRPRGDGRGDAGARRGRAADAAEARGGAQARPGRGSRNVADLRRRSLAGARRGRGGAGRRHPLLRLLADVRGGGSLARRQRSTSRRDGTSIATKIWTASVEEGRGSTRSSAASSDASRSSRCTTSSPGGSTCRGSSASAPKGGSTASASPTGAQVRSPSSRRRFEPSASTPFRSR